MTLLATGRAHRSGSWGMASSAVGQVESRVGLSGSTPHNRDVARVSARRRCMFVHDKVVKGAYEGNASLRPDAIATVGRFRHDDHGGPIVVSLQILEHAAGARPDRLECILAQPLIAGLNERGDDGVPPVGKGRLWPSAHITGVARPSEDYERASRGCAVDSDRCSFPAYRRRVWRDVGDIGIPCRRSRPRSSLRLQHVIEGHKGQPALSGRRVGLRGPHRPRRREKDCRPHCPRRHLRDELSEVGTRRRHREPRAQTCRRIAPPFAYGQ